VEVEGKCTGKEPLRRSGSVAGKRAGVREGRGETTKRKFKGNLKGRQRGEKKSEIGGEGTGLWEADENRTNEDSQEVTKRVPV